MPLLICPNCNVGMTQIQRSGVELDICPQCRGVWLDRGELEKLLQRFREPDPVPPQPSFLPASALQGATPWAPASPSYPASYGNEHYDEHRNHDEHGFRRDGGHQKKGWRNLRDVFD